MTRIAVRLGRGRRLRAGACRISLDLMPGRSLLRPILDGRGRLYCARRTGLDRGVMGRAAGGKGLALSAGKPLIAVNHLEGHALSPRLVDAKLDFPYLLLLASGGHCQLLEVRGVGDYRRLATTVDDAAGEAFDKAAKLLGLGYPGGPAIEALAKDGDPAAVPLPRPLVGSREPHFSFAGLKGAVQRVVADAKYRPEDVAASFQQAVVDCFVDRTRLALKTSDARLWWLPAG